ncbi:MAG: RHS repeat-associated core domain-containing protein [Thermoanaerobaculia bacterium]
MNYRAGSSSSGIVARNLGKSPNPKLRANYKADNRQETIDRRQEGLWSNVNSPKSLAESNSPENYFYFLNGHGDVTYFADANFTPELIESYEYNPWGVLLTSASENNLLYTSKEFDFETGLQFNRNIYYNANLGRFIQKDFIFKNHNLFKCGYNSPINYNDPTGYFEISTYVKCLMPPLTTEECLGSLSSCLIFCNDMGNYFAALCAKEFDLCLENCNSNPRCIEICHSNFHWCMLSVIIIKCECYRNCYLLLCGGEESPSFDLSNIPDIY